MKALISFLLLFIFSLQIQGQQVFQQYTKLNGCLRYGNSNNECLPFGNRGFTLITPDKQDPLLGTIVMLEDDKIDLQDSTINRYIPIDREASAKGFAILYISTGIPVDLYFSAASLIYVDTAMKHISLLPGTSSTKWN
jgi:hypothetical protein